MRFLLPILLVFCTIGCSKYEIETIEGNTPPSETVITKEIKENYVNRLYISLIGRKATQDEFSDALKTLGNTASEGKRQIVIADIMAKEGYRDRLYDIARADYLEGVDTGLIRRDYQQALASLQQATGNSRDYWQEVVNELMQLVLIPSQLDSGVVDHIEIHRRIVNNPYYDDINMGTENFVVATFQQFLFRYPTQSELSRASTMVDGFPSSLFLKPGSSKQDFITIFFDSENYFEGQVINLFQRYLFRFPDSAEMIELTGAYASDKDFQNLQTLILGSDEYFFN